MKPLTSHFDSTRMEKNAFCRFTNSHLEEQYQSIYTPANKSSTLTKTINTNNSQIEQVEDVVNLEELWNSLENEPSKEQHHERGRIRVSIMNIEEVQPQQQLSEELCEFTDQEFQMMLATNEEPKVKQEVHEQAKEDEVEDLGDIWDQVDKQQPSLLQNPSKQQPRTLPQSQLHTLNQAEAVSKGQKFDLAALLDQKSQKSLNFSLNRDYLIYDYQRFVLSCFQTNIHSYFGFTESPQKPTQFYLYDLTTKQPVLQCSMDIYDESFLKSTSRKVKIDYQIQYCLKFRLAKSKQLVATAFHKYINNGILYSLKPYNHYENHYEDSLALIQITDGFIGNNCYCNTNVFISQKYTNQPGQLKMIIGVKNGYLIANMGVNGVKSAPYNCRLQNYQSNFVYLLGLIDKESSEFIVRVGEGMSPLIAFAISIGRKRYIDSFSE